MGRFLSWSCVGLVAVGAAGCGLLLDVSPHEDAGSGQPGLDGGSSMDAAAGADAGGGQGDGATVEAGLLEASVPPGDGGPSVDCSNRDDCPDDGDACTFADCVEGRCRYPAVVCDDGIACTRDGCDPDSGCAHEPDDSACPATSTDCLRSVCVAGVGCEPEPDASECADGVACTVETCSSGGECVVLPSDDYCARTVGPGSQCEATSGCTPVECSTDVGCGPGGPCQVREGCVDGFCSYRDQAPGAACDDGDPCTTASECDGSGSCVPTASRSCDDDNPCTRERCVATSPTTATCSTEPVAGGTTCDDEDPCTGAGTCDGGVCQGGAIDCSSADRPSECMAGMCTESGCAPVFTCERDQRCVGGHCESSTAPDGGTKADAGSTITPDDAGGLCQPVDEGSRYCSSTGTQDCDEDGCCECDRRGSYCTTSKECAPYDPCPEDCEASGLLCCRCGGFCYLDSLDCPSDCDLAVRSP